MLIDCTEVPSKDVYHVMAQTIIPRPIAWVLSDNGNETYNLAPFSFFNGVCSNPPILALSVGKKHEAQKKDTWHNIEERKYFVVMIPSVDSGENVVATSKALEHGDSELKAIQAELCLVEGWPLPRINGPKVAFFCQKHVIYEIGHAPQGLILGEIKSIWLDEGIIERKDDRLVIDAGEINPLARLGGNEYCALGDRLTLKHAST